VRFEILSNTVGLWYHVVCLECNSVSEDPSASNTRVNNHLLQWWSQQNPLKCRYTSPTLLLHYTMLRDPSASITRVNNHLLQWWSQQNPLKCWYTSPTLLLHYTMLRDPSASITRVNNHLPQWWSQQNPLKCRYTSTTLHDVTWSFCLHHQGKQSSTSMMESAESS